MNRLKSRGFRASGLSACDFSTLYTALPHNLIKDKLVDLVERTFRGEGSLCVACNDGGAFFTSGAVGGCSLWSCRRVCGALTFLLDNIYIRFGSGLCGRIVGVPMGADCAPLVAGLFLFCCGGDFMLSFSGDSQSGVIEAFNSTSRCLGGLLGIGGGFFDSMVSRMCPSGLQLGRASVSDAGASFLDLHLSISDGFVKTKIYDGRDGFGFDVVDFPFLDGGVPRSHPVVFVFLNLFDLLGFRVVLRTLVLVVGFWRPSFSDKDIDIINFVRHSQNFIGGILT